MKRKIRNKAQFPAATVAYYGPDDKTPVKIVVGLPFLSLLAREARERKKDLKENVG